MPAEKRRTIPRAPTLDGGPHTSGQKALKPCGSQNVKSAREVHSTLEAKSSDVPSQAPENLRAGHGTIRNMCLMF